MGLRGGATENNHLCLGGTDREAHAGTEIVHAINQLLQASRREREQDHIIGIDQ